MQPTNEKNKVGFLIGYMSAATLATIILYTILKLLDKIPQNWTILHVAGIIFTIALLAAGVKRALR